MERFCEVHGMHSDWRQRPIKRTWTCIRCRKQQRTNRKVEQNYEALKKLFGKELADQYMEKLRKGELPPDVMKKLKLK